LRILKFIWQKGLNVAEDPEIKAMSEVADALKELEEEEARVRVLRWATTRFAPSVRVSSGRSEALDESESEDEEGRTLTSEYQVFADLFDAARPRTDPERALVGGYWTQVIEQNSDFASQTVNNALKDVGHGIGNITDALGALQDRRPSLVRQVQKSGRTRQARKKYKLTSAGIAAVERMIRGEGEG
jgi:hypothetical protein